MRRLGEGVGNFFFFDGDGAGVLLTVASFSFGDVEVTLAVS